MQRKLEPWQVKPVDFEDTIHALPYLIKIQSLFHRHAACVRVKKLAQQKRQELLARKAIQDTERAAVIAFVGQLRKKANLSPEAFFRVCDTAYARRISKTAFREGLTHFKMSLTEAEVRRLLLVFDENFSDFISLDEYQQTLEAFQVTGEKHFIGPTKSGKGYTSFESQVLERMLATMEERQISPSDLFNACDKDGSNSINLKELKQFFLSQDSTLLIKEQEAMQSYFSKLDTDRSGVLSKPEFLQQFDCAKVLVQKKKVRDCERAEDDEFGEEEAFGADQGMFSDARESFQTWAAAAPSQPDPKIRKIANKLQTHGFSLPKFNEYLQLENVTRAPKMETRTFLGVFKAAYPGLPVPELTQLMTQFQSASDVRHVNAGDFKQFSETYKASQAVQKPAFIFRFISNCVLRVASAAQPKQTQPHQLIEQQLNQQKAKLSTPNSLTFPEFEQLVTLYCKVPPADLKVCFSAIPQGNSPHVPFDAFKESVLVHHSSDLTSGPNSALHLDPLIPGYSQMSPRTQCDRAVSELITQMKKQDLKPISVFRMANGKSTSDSSVSNLKLQLAFQKQTPQTKPQLIQGALRSFGKETAHVNEAEFLTTFDEAFDQTVASTVPNSRANRTPAQRTRPSTASAVVSAKPEDTLGLVRKLDKIFLDQGLGPLQAFKAADLDGNGVVLLSELKEAFKTYLPDSSVTPADLKMTMIAFDANRNGRIEQQEFIDTFAIARQQNMTSASSRKEAVRASDSDLERVSSSLDQSRVVASASLPASKLLLKAILNEAMLKSAQFTALPVSLLKTYWKREEPANTHTLLQSVTCLSQNEQSALNKHLATQSFAEAMQSALDLFFESVNQMDPPSDLDLILSCPVDAAGVVAITTVKRIFAQIHMQNQNNLFFRVNSLYTDLFGQEMTHKQMVLLFNNELLLKSLFLTPSQESQPQQGINYLIFASNVSLAKNEESQYLGEQRKAVWRKIVARYLTIFYDACLPSGSTQPEQVHQQISHLFKALKQASLLQLISLLDKNVVYKSNPQVSQASKALCQLKGLRVRHAPLLRQRIQIDQLLQHAQQLLAGESIQQSVQIEQQLPASLSQSQSQSQTGQQQQTSILQLQTLLKQPFEEFLRPFLLQDFIPAHQFFKECQKKNKAISKSIVADIAKQALAQDRNNGNETLGKSILGAEQEKTRQEMVKIAEELAQYEQSVIAKVDQAYRHYEANFPVESRDSAYKSLEDHVVAIKTTANKLNKEIKKSDLQSVISVFKQVKNKPLNRLQFILEQMKALKQTPQVQTTTQQDLFDEDKLLSQTLAELNIPSVSTAPQDLPVRGLVQLTAAIPSKQKQLEQQIQSFVSSLALPLSRSVKDLVSGQDQISLDDFFEFIQTASSKVKLSQFAQIYLFIQASQPASDPTLSTQALITHCASIRGIHQDEAPKQKTSETVDKTLTQDIIQRNMKNSLQNKVQRKTITGRAKLKSQRTQRQNQSLKSQKTLVKETKSCSELAKKIVNFILPANIGEQQVKEVDHDPLYGIEVNSKVALKVISSLVRLQKVVNNREKLRATLMKFQDWLDSNGTGDIEESQQFLTDQFVKVLKTNSNVSELNILMIRFGFSQIKDSSGQPLFNIFELLQLMFLASERDGFYQLEVDFDFVRQLMHCPEPNEDDGIRFNLFLEECVTRQVVCLDLAMMVVSQADTLSKANQELDICNTAIWTKCRFSFIASQFIAQLQIPQKKAKFIETFKNAYRQQLNYFDFFKLVNDVLEVKNIQEWMYEDLESHLDDYGLALIEFSDVIEFLQVHDFDLGIKAEKAFDDEEVFKKKMNVNPHTYQLDPRKDFFRGVPSILNSEEAALAYCFKIEAELTKANQSRFTDKDFGPKDDDDLEGNATSLYFKGVKPQSHPDPEQISWKRPDDYLEGKEGHFLQGDASSNEVKQGALGDCWFIGALSVLATRDELLRGGADLVPPQFAQLVDAEIAGLLSMGVYPPLFHKFRKFGMYVMRFFKACKWRYVVIDERVPVYRSSNLPVFGRCQDVTELWVPLIEKAYAKLHGCYQTLISGFIDDGLADLTAMVCEKKTLHDKSGLFSEDKEKFWTFLEDMKQFQCLMGCSVSGGTEQGVRIDGVPTGIMSGHAYSLNDVFELHDQNMENARKTHRLLRVRNPWGRGEWKGKWSDMSEEMEQFEQKMQKEYIDQLPEEEQFTIGDNDGTFFINYASWRDIYNRLFVVNDFPDDWSAVRFSSKWTPASSGGLPIDIVNGKQQKTQAAMQRFATNPQFLICPQEDCQLFVSLAQQDGREQKANGEYSQYPFKDRIRSSMLFLFELEASESKLSQYRDPLMKATPKVLHEISLRINVKAGKKYVVMPVPRERGITADFTLSFYFDQPVHDVQLLRIGHPEERYSFIQEEFEKSERRVPAWKIEYLKNNLNTMIGNKDASNLQRKMTRKKTSVASKRKIQSRKTQRLLDQFVNQNEEDSFGSDQEDDEDEDIDMA